MNVNLNLKSLKVFCDVVSRRSFSRAAADNGITQSAASQVVQQLEDRLGVQLLDRSKRPFVLTAEGDVYHNGCRKLLRGYLKLEDEVRSLHEEVAGRVRVASIYSIGLSHMNSFLQEFMAQHPKANVRLEYQHPNVVHDMVENDQVDIGLISYPKSSRTVEAIPWRVEPMVVVCSPRHLLAEREEVTLAELDGATLVGFDDGLKIRREIDRALAAAEAEVTMAMEFDNIETIKRAVEIDAGITLLPIDTVAAELEAGTLAAVSIAESELVRPVGIVTRRGKQLTRAARRFIEMLQERVAPSTNGQPAKQSEETKQKTPAYT